MRQRQPKAAILFLGSGLILSRERPSQTHVTNLTSQTQLIILSAPAPVAPSTPPKSLSSMPSTSIRTNAAGFPPSPPSSSPSSHRTYIIDDEPSN
ncbi:hypothetical protein GYMLUDRAFT_252313 [Collybiopsis luxurians FD-317 M1]|uniref:Uncharacterized protein n=1 Tax=Collybiopsis luxurians FD-317 M1 TaxID=944289 RepID=A0A0D0BNU1_9AGAR|nr:hypothetical protein GYMLUDRAFT_252313 [Collybiopsis luxurians FD-317 M1]